VIQFRQAMADCRELFKACVRECLAECPESLGGTPESFVERMRNLERGVLVKVFVDIAQSDGRITASEFSLAAELFEHAWRTKVEPARLRETLKQVADQAAELTWGSLVRPFAQLPPLRKRVAELETIVVRLANLVAKIDGHVTPDETTKLKWIQHELECSLVAIPVEADDDDDDLPIVKRCQTVKQAVADDDDDWSLPMPAVASDAVTRARQLASALEELHGLIGLATIKHDVQELVNFLKVQGERAKLGLPRTEVSLHMLFCGNPGTGKTTVARLLGRIFGGMGILARGHLIETDRSGLVAKYAGQTGPKTHKKVDEALDGVLFIDEAYSLVAEGGDDPYGGEAVQALLKRIEDDRRRLVVVLAGYPAPMQDLLDSNPGLASRFGRRLDFADYTASELGRIFQVMCEQNRYVLPAATRWKLLVGFQYLLDRRDETFGNGRLARNVFEASIRRLANRVADIVPLTVEALTTLEPADIAFTGVPETAFDVEASERRLTVTCPGCSKPVRFGAATLGKKVSCKQCRHEFQLDWGELAAK
jgi:tellurite resistance protein